MPSATVCIPTYNGSRFILDQLSSIITAFEKSGYSEWHILVSDDGSTDQTVEKIQSLENHRIKLMKGPCAGVVKNIESLLVHAHGDHIYLSDQDDYWLENRVTATAPFLENFDLVVCDAAVVDVNLARQGVNLSDLTRPDKSLIANIVRNRFTGACISFRRDAIKKFTPFPAEPILHDWWIGVISCIYFKIHFHSQTLVLFRRHENNVTSINKNLNINMHSVIMRIKLMYHLSLHTFRQ